MDDFTLDFITDQIVKEKCILILGPDITLTDTDITINQQLKEVLQKSLGGKIKNYFSDDEFFSFSTPNAENMALSRIGAFFKNLQPRDIYKKIADIPFHIIISISPDRLLDDIFVQNNYSKTYAFYNKMGNPRDLDMPVTENPLLYNLFGDMEVSESLIYTYDHLFEYLESIFGNPGLPLTLKKILQDETNNILFIGFKFEKWYFKLLIRLLKLHKIKSKNASGKEKSMQEEMVRNFYTDEFEVEFIDDDETDIINSIYGKCNELGILRSKSASVIADKPAIYISYGWGEFSDSEKVVGQLYDAFIAKGYNIIRDKNNLGYKGNIDQFMQLIGKGNYVIVVISDKYLKSINCMYEMAQIYANGGEVIKRLFPIVLGDAKIYTSADRNAYIAFWESEEKRYNDIISSGGEILNRLSEIDNLKKSKDIKEKIGLVLEQVSGINTLTADMLLNSGFAEIMKALDLQMEEDKKTSRP